jgi:hypothetical protein
LGPLSLREEGQLKATLNFVDEKASPTAERVWQGIKQGSLRAVSVGFRCGNVTSQPVGDKTVYVLSSNQLMEISVVPLPANPEAVIAAEKSLTIIRALAKSSAPQETPIMSAAATFTAKTLLAAIGLNDTATEAEAVEKYKTLEKRVTDAEARASAAESTRATSDDQVSQVLAAVSADSFEKALGAIEAAKAAAASLSEQIKKNEDLERGKLISDAKAAKKLTPHQEKGLEGKSLDFVRGFLELQAPHAALTSDEPVEPSKTKTGELTHNGKTWAELEPREKHALHGENFDLYKLMRDSAT